MQFSADLGHHPGDGGDRLKTDFSADIKPFWAFQRIFALFEKHQFSAEDVKNPKDRLNSELFGGS